MNRERNRRQDYEQPIHIQLVSDSVSARSARDIDVTEALQEPL